MLQCEIVAIIHFFICHDISWPFSVFVSWVEVPTEMPTSPIMSDLEVDDTVRDTKRSCDLWPNNRWDGTCNHHVDSGWLCFCTGDCRDFQHCEQGGLSKESSTIWCFFRACELLESTQIWPCHPFETSIFLAEFEQPRYLLLSPRCSAVGVLSCESVLLAHVVLKLIALIVEEKWCLQKLSAAEMFPFYRHIFVHRCW